MVTDKVRIADFLITLSRLKLHNSNHYEIRIELGNYWEGGWNDSI